MKRRDFIRAAAGVAGTFASPSSIFAQSRPCPPPLVTAGGESTVETSCGTQSSGSTVLGSLIASLGVKQWVQLPVAWSGGSNAFWRTSNASGSLLDYSHDGAYDATRKKVAFVGGGYGNCGYVTYDEVGNTWAMAEQSGDGIIHAWDHQAYDASRGHLYYSDELGGSTRRFTIANGTKTPAYAAGPWSGASDTYMMAWWPSLDAAVSISRGGIVKRLLAGTTTWVDWTTTGWTGGYQCMMAHDHVRNVMWFGGGSGSERTFWKLNADGTSQVATTNGPTLYVTQSILLCDPLSGNPVVLNVSTGTVSEYVVGNGWSTVSTTPPSGLRRSRSVGIPLSGHDSGRGILMYCTVGDGVGSDGQVWLYRHA